MIVIRSSASRGVSESEWLASYHTFSFADYRDDNFMSYRCMGVLNEDVLQPGGEFEPHAHSEVEILSLVLEGELTIKDSMGSVSTVSQGQAHLLTAGTGILHQECNTARRRPVHYLQAWIVPADKKLQPRERMTTFDVLPGCTELQKIVGSEQTSKEDQSYLCAHQDIAVYFATIAPGEKLDNDFGKDRYLWVQNLGEDLTVNNVLLSRGDGASIEQEALLTLSSDAGTSFLLFDMN